MADAPRPTATRLRRSTRGHRGAQGVGKRQLSASHRPFDFYWPELRLAVEVDAYGTHGSRTRFEQDRRRDARLLTEHGIVVLRVIRLAVQTRPFEIVAFVARAIAQREASR